jgi:hypothetical protein
LDETLMTLKELMTADTFPSSGHKGYISASASIRVHLRLTFGAAHPRSE